MMTGDELKAAGMQLFQQGAYAEAAAKFETAVSAYAAAADEAGRAEALNNLGVIQRLNNNAAASEKALTEAAELFAKLGDQNRQAQALGNLGDLRARKDPTAAAQFYSNAAQLFAEDGDGERQSQVLRALSLLHIRQGQLVQAMFRMEDSLSARPRLGPLQWLWRGMLRFALQLFGGT